MQTCRADDVEATAFSSHRGGGIRFQRLLQGTPGAPDNYELSITHVDREYRTPRHRHNFDQLHLTLEGAHSFLPGRSAPAGAVTYYPEGVFYGPQRGDDAVQLSLQLGGPSGHGFASYDEVAEASLALAEEGSFEDGIYRWVGDDGTEHRKDGYEAIWERCRGRPVRYPPPRLEQPLVMLPDAYGWSAGDEAGVEHKRLATLNERGTSVSFLRCAAGAQHRVARLEVTELHVLLEGQVRIEGDVYEPVTAFAFEPGDQVVLDAIDATVVYTIRLPAFTQASPMVASAAGAS